MVQKVIAFPQKVAAPEVIGIYLPRSKACEMSFREILLDKVSGFGYIMVDESIWRPAGA